MVQLGHSQIFGSTTLAAFQRMLVGVGAALFVQAGYADGSDYSYRSMLEDTQWLKVALPRVPGESSGQGEEAWRDDADVGADDRYLGLSGNFKGGLGVDTGIAEYTDPQPDNRYREYYFGLSYDSVEGRVWYTDDYLGMGGSKSFYELGVKGMVRNNIALGAKVGYSSFEGASDMENFTAFVLSAEKPDVYGFGLNLQLVGSQNPLWSDKEDFRLMGTISREFR